MQRADGTVTVTLDDGAEVTGDELLVAVGRTPQVEGLGLETVGIEPDGYIDATRHCRVPGHDWLYVIGDINGTRGVHAHGEVQARGRVRPRPRQGHRARARRRRPGTRRG